MKEISIEELKRIKRYNKKLKETIPRMCKHRKWDKKVPVCEKKNTDVAHCNKMNMDMCSFYVSLRVDV